MDDGFSGTGTNFSMGDPFEETVAIDVFGDPVIQEPLGIFSMTYSLTVGSYSASGNRFTTLRWRRRGRSPFSGARGVGCRFVCVRRKS